MNKIISQFILGVSFLFVASNTHSQNEYNILWYGCSEGLYIGDSMNTFRFYTLDSLHLKMDSKNMKFSMNRFSLSKRSVTYDITSIKKEGLFTIYDVSGNFAASQSLRSTPGRNRTFIHKGPFKIKVHHQRELIILELSSERNVMICSNRVLDEWIKQSNDNGLLSEFLND